MKRLLIVAGLAAAFGATYHSARAESAFENCHVVRATADARNAEIATDRAVHRLRRYVAFHVSTPGGKSVGPTHTRCIRTACEASAIVCKH